MRKYCPQWFVLFLGVWILADLGARVGAEIFWFQEVGYLSALLLRLVTQGALWAIGTGLTAGVLLTNLAVAGRLKYPDTAIAEDTNPPTENRRTYTTIGPSAPSASVKRSRITGAPVRSRPLRLRSLLPLTVGLSLLAGLLLAHYSQTALDYWQADLSEMHRPMPVPALFRPSGLWQVGHQLNAPPWWQIGLVLAAAIALLLYHRVLLTVIAIVLSALMGLVLSQHWARVLQFLQPTAFNTTEPLFNRDISFYVFGLPVGQLLEFWLTGLFLYGFIAVLLTYLLSADSLSQGWFPGFSPPQQRHLCGMGGGLMLVVAFSYWLSRYELLYSTRGVTYGAGYTDAIAQLPAYTMLSIAALAIAAYLLWRSVLWQTKPRRPWLLYGLGLYGMLIVAGTAVPTVVQYLVVEPNELERERLYIERTIALTRKAFDLEAIEVRTFNPQGELTEADLRANALTIRNVRLWDKRPLLETNRQLQQFRPYYRFPDADIDRYTLQTNTPTREPSAAQPSAALEPKTERRQVLIAARELDYSAVPPQAQTWVNRHLIYTHGYGFTLSPVNTVGPGGLPEYFVSNISGRNGEALNTSSEAVRASIPIGQPRIYYGEISDSYVLTGTQVQELNYPSGSDNVYTTYAGQGGITIGSLWRRWLFALYLKDWRLIFTREVTPATKVLMRQNIKQRIRTIAPFLQFDSDPYLVTADTRTGSSQDQSYLFWIVDAYTTSDRFPYSDAGSEGINYIRNSVKVVIDAYHGSVDFYVADPTDPIISSWSAIFPGMFQPIDAMPLNLRSHVRYPVDFFKLQSDRLMTYHMTDPQVFYNREDQWQIPNEVYGSEAQPVEPYYLITSLPTVPFEEFILLLPYTPKQRTNLIAWLAARSDGENYGKCLLYIFPKERLVYGTEQIEARINQDPVISQQISLWNRQGSRALQGNLLVIPIEQSLLYIEPLYLEAAQNSLPTLVRVIVAYENRIVMAQTLEASLQAIFQPEVTKAPPIVRPVEEPAPSGQ